MPFPGKDLLLGGAEALDAAVLAPLLGARSADDGVLVAFLFHRFFRAEELADGCAAYPHERVTVELFARFVEQLAAAGFAFVLPADLAAGAELPARAAILTVDDGYADNLRILPILERLDARAVVFVSTAHVREGLRFWPDALYAGAARMGWSPARKRRAVRLLTRLPHEAAAGRLEAWFGPGIMTPDGDADRPLSEAELRVLAASPRVELGTHAHHHTVLAPRAPAFVGGEIGASIDVLERIVGRPPLAVSYPNGVYSGALVAQCRDMGLKVGFTIEPRHERLCRGRLNGEPLRLGRFTVSGRRCLARQIASAAMPHSLMRAVYRLRRSHRVEA